MCPLNRNASKNLKGTLLIVAFEEVKGGEKLTSLRFVDVVFV